MTEMGYRVLCATAVLNQEREIGPVIDQIDPGDVTEVVVVDDGSMDGTPEVLTRRGVKVLRNHAQQGVGAALRQLTSYAREQGFDILVTIAGNGKDAPREIPRLLRPIVEEGFDFVQGSRFMEGGRYGNMPSYRWIATRFIHPWFFYLITKRRLTDTTNGFRAFRLSILEDRRIDLGQSWLDHYEMEPYLLYKAVTLGYRVAEVPVTKIYPVRGSGYTRMKPVTGWWSVLRPFILLGLGLKR